jgi:hypothetical protein
MSPHLHLTPQENIGIVDQDAGTDIATIPVPAVTVDQLVFGGSLYFPQTGADVPIILTIDTEGHDPLVLKGARRALATGLVAYVEFEYHGTPPAHVLVSGTPRAAQPVRSCWPESGSLDPFCVCVCVW